MKTKVLILSSLALAAAAALAAPARAEGPAYVQLQNADGLIGRGAGRVEDLAAGARRWSDNTRALPSVAAAPQGKEGQDAAPLEPGPQAQENLRPEPPSPKKASAGLRNNEKDFIRGVSGLGTIAGAAVGGVAAGVSVGGFLAVLGGVLLGSFCGGVAGALIGLGIIAIFG